MQQNDSLADGSPKGEAAAAEPSLLYTIRAGSCTRAESISTDGGMNWGTATIAPSPMVRVLLLATSLTALLVARGLAVGRCSHVAALLLSLQNEDPGCKGGITRWESGRALVFANAGTCHGRIDTTVRLSLE